MAEYGVFLKGKLIERGFFGANGYNRALRVADVQDPDYEIRRIDEDESFREATRIERLAADYSG